MLIRNYSFFAFFLILLISCEPDNHDDHDDDNGDNFDRTAMLINWADNIIIPAYDDFYVSLNSLNEAINSFISAPNSNSLEQASEAWLNSYKYWQHVEMFDIGLAEVINYKGKMNIYPTDSDLIDQNIITGNYDLNNNNNFDSRGFPAIDYMLHGLAENSDDILNIYNTSASYSIYLSDLVSNMLSNTNLIIEDWSSYRDEFVNLSSNTATSSVNKMTNDFIYYFEKGLRANKIGIPAGIFSSEPLPHTVEAYYKKDVSKDLAIQALKASRNFFIGKHFNYDLEITSSIVGLSFEDYLNYLVSGTDNISSVINTQFENAENQLNQIDNNFVSQIELNNTEMLLTYDAIQLLVVSFKVDMLQTLGVSVDYVDADGD